MKSYEGLTTPVILYGPRPSVDGQSQDKVQLCGRHLEQYQRAYLACHGRMAVAGGPLNAPCTACAFERVRR